MISLGDIENLGVLKGAYRLLHRHTTAFTLVWIVPEIVFTSYLPLLFDYNQLKQFLLYIMKSFAGLLVLLAAANAAPIDQSVELMERQLGGASTRNDLVDGDAAACPGSIFIFARASGEDGNIVRSHETVMTMPHILTGI
jgi:hypothetical protein